MRALLSDPRVYEAFQRLVGAKRGRQRLVRDVIRPGPAARLLDIGCGPGGLLAELPPDVDYVGFDGSAEYIEAARKRFGVRGVFVHGLVTPDWSWDATDRFDRVVAIGVLHHLDDESARALLRTAASLLRPGGCFVSLDPTRTAHQNPLARRLVDRDRGEYVRSPDGYRALACDVFDPLEVSVRTDLLRIPYTHVTMCGFAGDAG